MRKTKIIPITPPTRELHEHFCDLCEQSLDFDEGAGQYATREAEIEMRTGANYPEGGETTTTTFDICTKCFKTKLMPWFESLGVKPRVEQTDW